MPSTLPSIAFDRRRGVFPLILMRVTGNTESTIQKKPDGNRSCSRHWLVQLVRAPNNRGHLCSAIQEYLENDDHIDECLLPYLESVEQTSSQQALDQLLISIAKPLVDQILQRALRETAKTGLVREDSPDILNEVLLKLLARLKALKSDPRVNSIANFRGLVAITTYRTITDQLRQRDRRRTNQEKKLRRLFGANPKLLIWKNSVGRVVCGYQTWKEGHDESTSETQLTNDVLHLSSTLDDAPEGFDTAELVLLLLDEVGRPIGFNDLVSVLSTLQIPHESAGRTSDRVLLSPVATDPDPASAYELRALLAQLFDEIEKLNLVQRQALLLNMTDSYGFSIEWFLFTGLANETQLANLLDLSLEEFTQVLDRLPMTDKEIARRLNLDASKLGNIRKAVRDRLERRRDAFLRGIS